MHRLLYAVVYCNTRAGNWQFSCLCNLGCVSSNAILSYSFISRHDTSFICDSSSTVLSIYLSISSMYWWTSWSWGGNISAQILFKKRFVCEKLYRLRLTEYTNAKWLPSIERNQPKMYFCEFDVFLIIINPNHKCRRRHETHERKKSRSIHTRLIFPWLPL